MNEKNVRFEKSSNNLYDAYYDATDLFVNLPTYIKKIEVQFATYLEEEELEREELLKYFKYAFNNQPVVTNNHLNMDAVTTTIHFNDGRKINVTNSEWGSLWLE